MPELVEVEYYRRAAQPFLGATIERVVAVDERFVRGTGDASRLRRSLRGVTITSLERTGKVLVVHTTGVALGLRFGMTGVLVAGGQDGLDELVYGPSRRDPAWLRLVLSTSVGELAVRDPRLLGSAELDPDLSRLGPDALGVTPAQLRAALVGSRAPLKARLMDQHRLAGVGNLIADEVLWRASLDPQRAAGSLFPVELRRLHRHLRATLDDLLVAGGSHQGRLTPQRHPGGCCPRDGTPLRRTTVGGRTTWWCPAHQRCEATSVTPARPATTGGSPGGRRVGRRAS